MTYNIQTSLNDYPKHPSTIIFLPGCNMRCSYCHNKVLAQRDEQLTYEDIEDIVKAVKHSRFPDHVVISGGEPTVHKELFLLLDMLRDSNSEMKIKLDTNGVNPRFILEWMNMLDYVALDVKAGHGKLYNKLGGNMYMVDSTMYLLNLWKKVVGPKRFDYEWRTTYHPDYVRFNHFESFIHFHNNAGEGKPRMWYIQRLDNETAKGINAYEKRFQDFCNKMNTAVKPRGIVIR